MIARVNGKQFTSWLRPSKRVPRSKKLDDLRAKGYAPLLIEAARRGGGRFKAGDETIVVLTSTTPRKSA